MKSIYIVRLARFQEVMVEESYPTLIVIMLIIRQTAIVLNGGFIQTGTGGTRTTLSVLFAKVYFIEKITSSVCDTNLNPNLIY